MDDIEVECGARSLKGREELDARFLGRLIAKSYIHSETRH
jgi:hypothetical protein